jgi:ribonuclease HII
LLGRFLEINKLEAGCDEAGRGCLAGPVCSAAVIMPADYNHPKLNDSKKLSPNIRDLLRRDIERNAISYAVAFIDNHVIDDLNILKASILGMHNALDQLSVQPDHILVDGNKFYPYRDIPFLCVVRGDGIYISIAAASILAKTYRDTYMKELHQRYNVYGWDQNKGYPTQMHRAAIQRHGLSDYHRRSFHLFDTQINIEFKHL